MSDREPDVQGTVRGVGDGPASPPGAPSLPRPRGSWWSRRHAVWVLLAVGLVAVIAVVVSLVLGGSPTCTRTDTGSCTLLGLVFSEPLPLDEALSTAEAFGGEAIAVYRTDAVCVPAISFQPVPVEPPELEASRFAYVDAWEIRDRRIEAIDAGLAPPITGLQTSVTYWNQWNDEWRQALKGGVLIAAVALYTNEQPATISAAPTISTVAVVPWRRTDSLSPSYPGELLVESKAFPGGDLPPAPPIDC